MQVAHILLLLGGQNVIIITSYAAHFVDVVLGALLCPRALFLDTYTSLSLESPRESRNHNLLPRLVFSMVELFNTTWCFTGDFHHMIEWRWWCWWMVMEGRRRRHYMKRCSVRRNWVTCINDFSLFNFNHYILILCGIMLLGGWGFYCAASK